MKFSGKVGNGPLEEIIRHWWWLGSYSGSRSFHYFLSTGRYGKFGCWKVTN